MKVIHLLEMAKRTTPDAFYKMAVAMYGAEKCKSVTMAEVKAVATKNDVLIPPYVVKNKVGRGLFNLKPEGTKDEPVVAKKPSDDVKKATVDRMIKDLGPLKFTGSGKEVTEDTLKQVAREIVGELKRLDPRGYNTTSDYQTDEYNGKKNVSVGVRDWGQWEVPEDEEDDGDFDWKVLTKEWSKKLNTFSDAMEKKYSHVRVSIQTGEKNYVDIQVGQK